MLLCLALTSANTPRMLNDLKFSGSALESRVSVIVPVLLSLIVGGLPSHSTHIQANWRLQMASRFERTEC